MVRARTVALSVVSVVLGVLAFTAGIAAAYALIALVVIGVPVLIFANGRSPSSRPGPGASGPERTGYRGNVAVGEEGAERP